MVDSDMIGLDWSGVFVSVSLKRKRKKGENGVLIIDQRNKNIVMILRFNR